MISFNIQNKGLYPLKFSKNEVREQDKSRVESEDGTRQGTQRLKIPKGPKHTSTNKK